MNNLFKHTIRPHVEDTDGNFENSLFAHLIFTSCSTECSTDAVSRASMPNEKGNDANILQNLIRILVDVFVTTQKSQSQIRKENEPHQHRAERFKFNF